MPKSLHIGKSGTDKLKNGIDKLNSAVACTLGAKGRNVIIGRHHGNAPHITKDGVTVSENFELEDPIENLGATVIKQAAAKTAELAGDGTTTSTILAHAIVTGGLKAINEGANPMDIKRGIDKACSEAVKHLKKLSKPVNTPALQLQIATISANNDSKVGKLVADAFGKVGADGIVTIEESKSFETTVDVIEGMQVDSGYLSPYFVTDQGREICELHNPQFILISGVVAMMSDIIPLLNKIVEEAQKTSAPIRPLVFIADSIKDEALATLVVNHVNQQMAMQCVAIAAPSFNDVRKFIMEDIAVFTGGKYIIEQKGLKVSTAEIDCIGYAEKVIVYKNKTLIIKGEGDKKQLMKYCLDLRKQLDENPVELQRKSILQRLASLTNGAAVINVGGATQIEVLEKKDRVDDAIRATKSAIEEGFVAGGGVTYVNCAKYLDTVHLHNNDQQLGIDIVKTALLSPIKMILSNAGISFTKRGLFNLFGKDILKEINKAPYGFGMNVKNDKFENLLNAGIIDSTKVARVALENAVSAAGTFLTTHCILNEIPNH